MPAPLECLPAELYSAIIAHVPPDLRQQTVLALSRAAARSPVPLYHLYEHIRLKTANSVYLLHRSLRRKPRKAAWIREFSLEGWSVDADLVINLIAVIPHLTRLRLFIGPRFAPEHLEELFRKPIEGLDFISLRFRPYVQQATYYQFLKGAYFDSTLMAFSRWPAPPLLALSIVQDPLDPTIAPNKFAQPLVFFRLDSLSALVQAPLLARLHSFRLRIPGRQAALFLYKLPRSVLSRLELLDMSTCSVLDADVEGLLGHFWRLRALVLDGCPVVSQRVEGPEGEPLGQWAAFGKKMALAGVRRTKERERKLKEWREGRAAKLQAAAAEGTEAGAEGDEPAPLEAARRARPGRRGLATATISLRPSPPRSTQPRTRGGGHNATLVQVQHEKIRIIPPLPQIRSLTTTPAQSVGPDKHAGIRAEFERGWMEGIALVTNIRRRLKTSWGRGTRIVSFDGDDFDDADDRFDGLSGLRDVEDERAFVIASTESTALGSSEVPGIDLGKCPILCLAGPGRNDFHVEGCGHQLGWTIWMDEL